MGAGSPAGLRFEAARDALLAAIAVPQRHGRVRAVGSGPPEPGAPDEGLTIHVEGEDVPLTADGVVLAIGGLAGGGDRVHAARERRRRRSRRAAPCRSRSRSPRPSRWATIAARSAW